MLVLLVLLAAIFFGVFNSLTGKSEGLTVVLAPKEFLQQVSISGKAVATDDVTLSFESTGSVTSVFVDEGDTVRAGASLVSLDSGTLFADLRSAQAEVTVKRVELDNRSVNLDTVEREQDTFVESARRTLYSQGLAAVPASDSSTLTPPVISGAYQSDAQGIYKIGVNARYVGSDDMLIYVFDLERTGAVKVPDNEPAKLGTRGLYISFPDGPKAYSDTTWYVSIPNVKSTSYLSNFNAYQEALRAREKAIATAQAELSGRSVGTTIAVAELRKAEAAVERIRAEIAKRSLRAPFAGVARSVEVQVGEVVSVNDPAVSLISNNELQIESFVPEINISYLSLGDPASITLDAYGEDVPFAARVVAIDPAETIRDGVTTYRVTLNLDTLDERVRSGMTANIIITTDRREGVLSVPQGAVKEAGGRQYVTVLLPDGTREERTVTLGSISSFGEVEILSGAVAGDTILLTP
jgi:HlyD family secretion protein